MVARFRFQFLFVCCSLNRLLSSCLLHRAVFGCLFEVLLAACPQWFFFCFTCCLLSVLFDSASPQRPILFPMSAAALGIICWPEVVLWDWFEWLCASRDRCRSSPSPHSSFIYLFEFLLVPMTFIFCVMFNWVFCSVLLRHNDPCCSHGSCGPREHQLARSSFVKLVRVAVCFPRSVSLSPLKL